MAVKVSVPVLVGSILAAGVLGFVAFPVVSLRLLGVGRERTRSLPEAPLPEPQGTPGERLKF